MKLPAWLARLTPERCVELFVLANFAFLGGDIAIAHLANRYADALEWAPLVFSAAAVPLLLPGMLGLISARVRHWIDLTVAAAAILLGVLGALFHLSSQFFLTPSLHNLVYAAPFAAPLAYIGVGLLLILVRIEAAGSRDFGPWVLVLSLGGILGNFALSLLDHAQNGFFQPTEWIPVAAAAFGASFLLVAICRPTPAFLQLCYGVSAFEALIGLLGFALHLRAEATSPGAGVLERLVYGAPAFAPLLFTNMALLSAIGLWASLRSDVSERAAA
ncbi:MAG: hypothetical protein JWN48_5726 [Myxococcaceae bacterium]|nr:hypothetical protein [Myxococcaceae bacterium]